MRREAVNAKRAAAERLARADRVKAGKCMSCGKRPARPSRRTCQVCASGMIQADRDRRRERKAAGLCIACGLLPSVAHDRCDDCDAKRKAFPSTGTNATREARRAAGQCIECGEGLCGDRYTRCAGCREAGAIKAKARADERKAAGKCACGRKQVSGYSKCRGCRRRVKLAWAEQRDGATWMAARRAGRAASQGARCAP
jgi:hypothetical protein